MHARALVEGRPYTDIGFIHTRFTTLIAPVAEPPAFPAAIAGVFAVAGESLEAVRVLLVVSLILFTLALWRYWRPLEGNAVAFVVVAWTIVALTRLHVVDTVLSDVPFAAALWGVFLMADATAPALGARRFLALAGLGALAFGVRMAALPLLPAIVVFAILRPAAERKGLACVALLWALSAAAVLYLLPGADALGSEVSRTVPEIVADVRINIAAAFEGARQWIPLTLPWPRANLALQGTLLVIAALGALVALREQPRRFAYITALWYLVMLIALPTRAARYLWPLYPLLTFGLIRGYRWLLDRAGIALGGRAPYVAVTVTTLAFVFGLYQDARSAPPRTLATEPDTRRLVDLFRQDAEARPRVAFFSPRVLAWEARITTTAFGSGAPEAIFAEVVRRRVTHVVVGDAQTGTPGTQETARMVAAHATSFAPVFRNASFVVYRFVGGPLR